LIAFKRTLFAIVLLLIAGLAVGSAQTSNGTVIGVVSDPAGNAVIGASVNVVSKDTNAVHVIKTNSEGAYRVESLQPGVYDISVSATGFETTVNKGLQVPGSMIVTANVTLKIGQVLDKVEVSADNVVINTDNGQVSGTISDLEITKLPIPSLNPYELALTLPGVLNTQQAGFSNGVNFNVGGGRPRANNFLIEGQDNNDAGIQGQGLQPSNAEAVKEVTILQDSYTAEYGHGAGSVSNMIFKSGTNRYHGSVFHRLQNSSLDALDKNAVYNGETGADKSKYRENMPGFTIGGPIIRNKLFAFGAYQWDFYRSSTNLDLLSIPNASGLALLKQYASSNPLVANLLQAYGGLVGNLPASGQWGLIKLGPDPTTGVDRGTVQVGTIARNVPAQDNAPELDLKGSYIISPSDNLDLRYIHNTFTAPIDVWNEPGQLAGFDSDQTGGAHNAGIVYTHTFSPSVINELRLSYGRIGFTFGLPSSTTSNPLFGQPGIGVTGIQGYGIPTAMPQGRFHDTYQLQDTVTWVKGKHTWKIGADVANIRVMDQIPFNFYGSIGYAISGSPVEVGEGEQSVKYSSLANFIDDYSGTGSMTQNFGSPTARPNIFSQNYFVADTWRVRPDLSVNYGLRYEYGGAPFNAVGTPFPGIDENNIACWPLPVGTNTAQSCNTKEQADKSEWGPRVGVAYSPTLWGQHKTVIHAGFGVFYDVLFTNIIDNIQASAPNNSAPTIYGLGTGRGNSAWSSNFTQLGQYKTPHPTDTAEPIVNNLVFPRTMHWNLGVEQELPWATSLQVGYVGERGTHLYGNTQLNPFVNYYEGGGRQYSTRGSIIARDNSVDSEYAGLWTQLDHKFSHQLLFRAAYTLGHAFDDGSEVFTTNNQSSYQFSTYPTPRGRTDWGPSAYDIRQRLVLTYVWSPSIWHAEGGMKVLSNIVNRWSVAGVTQFQTGATENVENGFDVNGDGISNDRPMLGNKQAPLTTWAVDGSWFGVQGLCSGPSFWNTNDACHPVNSSDVHWIVPGYDQYPLPPVGRNSMYSPGFQNWDMNISRTFKLHEGWDLDFRGEMLNIFNHGNFGIENTTLTSGIVSDQFNPDFGTNYFADPYPTVTGHRHVRLFLKVSF
jgi:Carboxypeptidase regulatory-like domain/TonB-dependent Receptor Plug Domain